MMKYININQLIISFSFCLFLLSACAKDEVDTMGDIHGIVSDESGNPIQAASVTLTPTGKTTTTGSDGRFEFNDLEPRQYTVLVTKVDYASNSKTLTIQAGEISKGDFILVKGLPKLKVSVPDLEFPTTVDALSFTITNTGVGNLEWEVKADVDWLSMAPSQGVTTNKEVSVVSVKLNRSALSPEEEYTHTLNIISKNGGGSAEVPIKVCAKIPKKLAITPDRLDFSANKTVEYLTVKKESGEGDISYTLSADESWIKLGENAMATTTGKVGDKESKVKVSVSRTGLTPGKKYTANITLQGDDANNIVVPVTMEVETVMLEVSSSRLEFSTDKSQLAFTLKNPQDTPIDYTISEDASWLSLSKSSGTLNASEDAITATVSREELSVGTHNATITIAAPGCQTVTIPVSVVKKPDDIVNPDDPYESVKITSCDPRISIVLVDCKRSGTSVVLNYTIENTGMGKDISFFRIYPAGAMTGYSEIHDDKGNQYKLPKMTIGSKSGSEQMIESVLPFKVKLNASITIRNFNADATRLSLVKTQCRAYPEKDYNLADKYFTFEDVPIYGDRQ